MHVLITGAAGAVGSALATRLPSYGWTVRGFDRMPVDGGIVGDITSASDLDEVAPRAGAVPR